MCKIVTLRCAQYKQLTRCALPLCPVLIMIKSWLEVSQKVSLFKCKQLKRCARPSQAKLHWQRAMRHANRSEELAVGE